MAVFLQDLPRLSAAGHSLSGLPGGAATYAAAQLARSTHAGEATGLTHYIPTYLSLLFVSCSCSPQNALRCKTTTSTVIDTISETAQAQKNQPKQPTESILMNVEDVNLPPQQRGFASARSPITPRGSFSTNTRSGSGYDRLAEKILPFSPSTRRQSVKGWNGSTSRSESLAWHCVEQTLQHYGGGSNHATPRSGDAVRKSLLSSSSNRRSLQASLTEISWPDLAS